MAPVCNLSRVIHHFSLRTTFLPVVGVHEGGFYEGGGGRRIKLGLHIKKNCISSLKSAVSVFPLLVCLSYVYFHLLSKLIAVDGQEDDFCLSSIILMNRNSTRIFFIIQIDIGK